MGLAGQDRDLTLRPRLQPSQFRLPLLCPRPHPRRQVAVVAEVR
jgi:hypothetical protein